MAAGALVIAIVSSQGSGAAMGQSAVSDSAPLLREESERAAPDYIATAPWLGALRLAPLGAGEASPTRLLLSAGSRLCELSCPQAESGGEADYEGGDARDLSQPIRVTRRACARARRGLATICAAVSERAEGQQPREKAVAPHHSVSAFAARFETCRAARKALAFYVSRYREWRTKMGAGAATPPGTVRSTCPRIRVMANMWKEKARHARLAYLRWFERTYEKYACIHRHEGAWNDADPPHYGGLQFDDSFQRTYGPTYFARWGHAGLWPVWAQLVAAERAYRTRGFRPWPNTARACGLL